MKHPFAYPRSRLIKSALFVALSTMLGFASAQPRLSGVPTAEEIAKALAAPAGSDTPNKVRTRGLKLDKSAEAEAPAPAAAAASGGKRSSLIMAQPAPAPQATQRAVDLEIQFAFGSDQLTPEGRAVLDQLAAALHSEALADVTGLVLEGHTDAVGSPAANRALSLRRANAARQYLAQRHRINPAAIRTVGKGSSELADPSNPTGAVNRRVRVIVES